MGFTSQPDSNTEFEIRTLEPALFNAFGAVIIIAACVCEAEQHKAEVFVLIENAGPRFSRLTLAARPYRISKAALSIDRAFVMEAAVEAGISEVARARAHLYEQTKRLELFAVPAVFRPVAKPARLLAQLWLSSEWTAEIKKIQEQNQNETLRALLTEIISVKPLIERWPVTAV